MRPPPPPIKRFIWHRRGVCMPYFWGPYAFFFLCRNPLNSTDFYAIRTPIAWHILGACCLQIWGVGVVRIIFNKVSPTSFCRLGRDKTSMGKVFGVVWMPRCAPFASLLSCEARGIATVISMTGRPGHRTMEMNGGSTVLYLARTPRATLFMLILIGLEAKGF